MKTTNDIRIAAIAAALNINPVECTPATHDNKQIETPEGDYLVLTSDEAEKAAAPDLLKTMEELRDMLAEHPEATVGNSKVHYMMHAASAAIAKATGEPQE